jgi:hypothetical protein
MQPPIGLGDGRKQMVVMAAEFIQHTKSGDDVE